MPFIDDDLLWCPDNDGKMVDLSCLVSACRAARLALRWCFIGGGKGALHSILADCLGRHRRIQGDSIHRACCFLSQTFRHLLQSFYKRQKYNSGSLHFQTVRFVYLFTSIPASGTH